MLRLLIAVDGSEHARNAIDTAARLGREGEVEAVLLHVREEHAYHGDLMPREYERIDEQARQHQAQILEAALGHAQRAGLLRLETQGEAGTPEVDIPRVAGERRADMIVMGTRGLGAVSALLLGSTAQRVVHNTNVPVLLVK
ncbi:MAG: universal stress protein [Burkholderiales bacterium]|nr:universal stress protein [Burkholderiales bacterium]